MTLYRVFATVLAALIGGVMEVSVGGVTTTEMPGSRFPSITEGASDFMALRFSDINANRV